MKQKRHTKNKQDIEIQARIYAFGIVFYAFISLLAARIMLSVHL